MYSWFVVLSLKNLSAHIRPITGHLGWRVESGDAHFSHSLCFAKENVCVFSPCIHVPDDARSECSGRVVEERYAQSYTGGRPLSRNDNGNTARAPATADWRTLNDAPLQCVFRIDFNGATFRVD